MATVKSGLVTLGTDLTTEIRAVGTQLSGVETRLTTILLRIEGEVTGLADRVTSLENSLNLNYTE